jgi:large subunit ribosomal protein L19
MSFELINKINQAQKKQAVVDARSGDTVRVYQKIKEGNKERIQMFEGVVIRTDNKKSHTSRITVRKIASGVGVEKSFLMHSPLIVESPQQSTIPGAVRRSLRNSRASKRRFVTLNSDT